MSSRKAKSESTESKAGIARRDFLVSSVAAAGTIAGVVHTKGRIPSFILTLAILITYWGLLVMLSGGYPRPIKGFDWITAPLVPRVPTPFLLSIPIVLAAIVVVLRTRLGAYFYAIGSNQEGARLAGIDVDRYRIIAFTLSGTFTGIGSIILFAHLGGSAPVDFNMNNVVRPLVAIILGGTPLAGGTGGWKAGSYAVVLSINGERALIVPFTVG